MAKHGFSCAVAPASRRQIDPPPRFPARIGRFLMRDARSPLRPTSAVSSLEKSVTFLARGKSGRLATGVPRIFLLSPAHCGGKRAGLLLDDRASFSLARQLRETGGAPLGEVFSFLSGLYFRGKLTYARAFARPPRALSGVFIITPGHGLRLPEEPIDVLRLREFAAIAVDTADARYREPFASDAEALAAAAGDSEVVLLGSVATTKYTSILAAAFGERLRFPATFIGRGDMSRGGLMLRCVRTGQELDYVQLFATVNRGRRPPRLEPGGRGKRNLERGETFS